LILKRKAQSGLSDLVSAGLPSVALRVPAHKTARSVLKVAACPIAAPSANTSGEISPTAPAHVAQSLGDNVDMILADGVCTVGLESTVVDCSGDGVLILRPGAITAEDIAQVLGEAVAYDLGDKESKPKSPGQLLKHYAPKIPVRLNAVDMQDGEALLAFGSTRFMGVKGKGAVSELPEDSIRNLSETGDLYEAAANLFAMLRALDRPEHTRIAVMSIPDQGVGVAINDRLRRAAASS
jgi:L-threonylcarbamoyladenylate synthase